MTGQDSQASATECALITLTANKEEMMSVKEIKAIKVGLLNTIENQKKHGEDNRKKGTWCRRKKMSIVEAKLAWEAHIQLKIDLLKIDPVNNYRTRGRNP